MSAIIRIWVEASHNPAFRCGGWAFVRRDGETLAGAAGGARGGSAERTALAALSAGLADLPAGAGVDLASSDKTIHAAWRRLAELRTGGAPPEADLDLWARLQTTTAGRMARMTAATLSPGGPAAFAKAWADQGYEKARSKGSFSAPIPKVNLARAGAA